MDNLGRRQKTFFWIGITALFVVSAMWILEDFVHLSENLVILMDAVKVLLLLVCLVTVAPMIGKLFKQKPTKNNN
jgi:hypothetical protein